MVSSEVLWTESCPSNVCAEALTPRVNAFGYRVFSRLLKLSEAIKVGPHSDRIRILIRRDATDSAYPPNSPPSCTKRKGHVRTQGEAALCKPGGEASPGTWILDFQSS